MLKNENELLMMEISVKAEHLKGLYEAVGKILSYTSLTDKFKFEVECIHSSFLSDKEIITAHNAEIEITLKQKDTAEFHFANTLELYNVSTSARDKTLKQMNSKITHLTTSLEQLTEEKDQVYEDMKDLEKRHNVLQQEYELLRAKIKQIRIKRRVLGDLQEEQNCKFCGKVFYESDNFAWSCRLHKSEFGGQIWWCCGKEGKDAVGCQLRKHVPNNDEDRLIEQPTDKVKSKICMSCKETGHLASECPKDPNPMSKIESFQREATRLQMTKKKKKQEEADDLKERAITELQSKPLSDNFKRSFITSINTSRDLEEAEFFSDVMRWKAETPFSKEEGLVNLDIDLEDFSNPGSSRKSTKRFSAVSLASKSPSSKVRFSFNG